MSELKMNGLITCNGCGCFLISNNPSEQCKACEEDDDK